jgi:EAL domain-containing protein (putative c-di-GMP-specific phosphodiesterase class I)
MLAQRRAPALVFQPIVDLQQAATVGYEVLSRFLGPPHATPDKWFMAAYEIGRGQELEALVIEQALAFRDRLPTNCFLSLNVAPEALLDPNVRQLLRGRPLSRLVLELTEHAQVADYDLLAHVIAEARELGAFVAVDDAGAGYASLQHILALRPDFVKLDRALIAGLQHDEAKAALVEMFGGFTSRIDAWLLAEGIEEPLELRRLAKLGVPLGQGYLLGRPGPAMQPLDRAIAQSMTRRSDPPEGAVTMLSLAEPHGTASVTDSNDLLAARFLRHPELGHVPLLDGNGRPVALCLRSGSELVRRPVMCVHESVLIPEALERAMTRPLNVRFDPLACENELGIYQGIVRIERMIEALLGTRR